LNGQTAELLLRKNVLNPEFSDNASLRVTIFGNSMLNMNSKRFAIAGLICAVVGLLLIFVVVRPFRDLAKDGPLAMIFWGMGATVAMVGFFVQPRAIALSVVALLANMIPMFAVTTVALLLGHSTLIWH
jgi:hypothetical protein